MNFLPDGFFNPTLWLVGIAVVVLLYIALREFGCWYLKTNRIIRLLEEIKKELVNNAANDVLKRTLERLDEIKKDMATDRQDHSPLPPSSPQA